MIITKKRPVRAARSCAASAPPCAAAPRRDGAGADRRSRAPPAAPRRASASSTCRTGSFRASGRRPPRAAGFEFTPTPQAARSRSAIGCWCSAASTASRRRRPASGSTATTPRRHAVPDRRPRRSRRGIARRHLDGPDRRQAHRQGHAAGSLELALESADCRRCDRLQLRLHQHHLPGAAPTHAAADGEQSARRLRAAVRRRRQHRRRSARRPRISRTAASSIRVTGEVVRAASAALGADDRAQARRVPRSRARRRAAHPEGRRAERHELPRVERPAGIPDDLRRAREADVRPAGAGLPDRPDARHHLHDRPRGQRPHLSRRSASPTPHHPIVAPPARPGEDRRSAPRSTRYHMSLFATTSRSCARRRTATARCSITSRSSTAPGSATATATCRTTCRSPGRRRRRQLKGGRHMQYTDGTPLANLHLDAARQARRRRSRSSATAPAR